MITVFYHYVRDGKSSVCSYNDQRVVTVETSRDRIYITSQVPTKVRNGAAIDELGFKMQAHQLLLCIAKLCGGYAFSSDECSVLEYICPKIEQTAPKLNNHQLEMLEKEYPVAYASYVSGDCIEGVLPMVLDVFSRYS